jgi:hypothetical protein
MSILEPPRRTVDRQALHSALDKAHRRYCIACALSSPAKLGDWLVDVRNSARRLEGLLETPLLEFADVDPGLSDTLGRLVEAAGRAYRADKASPKIRPEPSEKRKGPKSLLSRSPRELLVADLKRIFEDHFGRKVDIKGKDPSGPFINFVNDFSRDWSVERLSPQTVARALRGRDAPRRKVGRKSAD